MKYSKICPYCGQVNQASATVCKNCYESLASIMPSIEVEEVKNKYYKKCPVCGEKNYLEYKNQIIKTCQLCFFDRIDACESLMDEEKKDDYVKPLSKEEIIKTTNPSQLKTRVKRLALRSLSDYHVVNIPDREGIIGRYGTIDSAYFKGIDHISGNHLLFYYDKGECTIEDLNSTNGTCLNGVKCKPTVKYKIQKGDQIQISTLCFEVIEM